MKLIIAEKPQLGHAIADAIPGTGKTVNGCIEKGDYTITWAFGHLLDLKEPEDYDPSLKEWTLEALPIYYPDWGMKPKSGGKDKTPETRLAQIGKLLKQADMVIHAGDPDDEGQYLIDEILRWHHYTGPVKRMDTNDTTKAAMQRALANLRDNKPLEPIGWSAHARRVADVIVGYNCSRYFSLKNPGLLLTVGRVQTATLGLVVLRDMAIEGHTKQIYYEVMAKLDIAGTEVEARYEPAKNDKNLVDGRITALPYAADKADMLKNEVIPGIKITYEVVQEQPPLPFNLTELQSYCSSHFGYEPTQVLEITQSLRDNHSAITYNRSDCQYLSEEQYKEASATMAQVIKNISFAPKGMDMSLHSRCFDDSNLTAHTAIIPQNTAVDLQKLTDAEKNVYLAICKYYMAQFMPPAEKGRTKLTADVKDGGRLTATSSVILKEGYRSLFKKDPSDLSNDAESPLSTIKPGTYDGDVLDAWTVEKETKPPARYTKASLAKDMTRIARYVQDPDVKNLLLAKDKDKKGENGSIGTVATRGPIIDKLEERGYLESKGKSIISTPLGRELYRILPDELKKPDLTAYWWAIQEDIQAGTSEWTVLTENVLDMVKKVLKTDYPAVNMSIIPDRLKRGANAKVNLGPCPRCGSPVIEGKRGFGCSNFKEGCKFVIWKDPKGPIFQNTIITAAQAKKWLAGGWEAETETGEDGKTTKTGALVTKTQVTLKKLHSSKTGRPFAANVVLIDDPNNQYGPKFKMVFDEIDDRPVLGRCPRCGGEVKEFSSGFGCSNRDAGCKFIIWKQSKLTLLSKTTFTAKDVEKLLKGEGVSKSTLLRKDRRTKFTATLTMRDDPLSQYGPNFDLSFPDAKGGKKS